MTDTAKLIAGAVVAWLLLMQGRASASAPDATAGGASAGLGAGYEATQPFPIVIEVPRMVSPPVTVREPMAVCLGSGCPGSNLPISGIIPAGGSYTFAPTTVFADVAVPSTQLPVERDVQGASPHRFINASEVF